jgi:bacterioferritin-associated ferredoxin
MTGLMTKEEDKLSDEIMCDCTGTTRGKIISLFNQGFDLEAISRKTGVNTGCGGCEWEIESLIDALQNKK